MKFNVNKRSSPTSAYFSVGVHHAALVQFLYCKILAFFAQRILGLLEWLNYFRILNMNSRRMAFITDSLGPARTFNVELILIPGTPRGIVDVRAQFRFLFSFFPFSYSSFDGVTVGVLSRSYSTFKQAEIDSER